MTVVRIFFLATILFMTTCAPEGKVGWRLMLHQPGKKEIEVVKLPVRLDKDLSYSGEVDGVKIDLSFTVFEKYSSFKAQALSVRGDKHVYLSLQRDFTTEVPYNFNGEVLGDEIFRQSPHDVNAWIVTTIAEQAVPVVALKSGNTFEVAVNGSPYLYENFTSQAFYINEKRLALSSGDNGATPGLKPDTVKQMQLDYNADKTQVFAPGKVLPYYHTISTSTPHAFEGIVFTSYSNTLNGLRRDVNQYVADYFSGGKYKDYFGALSFTTAYMNLRVNETGKSKVWVVPSVEYGNTQYGRDAFWISMMLPPELAAECLKNELAKVDHFAEYPLFAILWAYRAYQAGITIDSAKVQAYVDAVELRVKDNQYYSYLESDGRLDFQYWGDLMAFEKDDVVTYNQGLLAVALLAAQTMKLNVKSSPSGAAEQYRKMFNTELGIYPTSKKKNNILGPDPLIGDLLSILYFNEPLVSDESVRQHYNRFVQHAKTPYGFKILSTPDGGYLAADQYDIPGYMSQVNREKLPDGRYFRGGSYFLYDNLFLIDAYLHNITEAEKLLQWRVALDFSIGNTTYETINTKTGEPWKPNMGWNVAVYSIWKKLVDEGKANDSLFNKIDSIARNQQY